MPGLVLELLTKEGQSVSEGDTLLVLEAMKMENEIKSPTAGTVSRISVEDGEAVQKGQLLIELDV